MSTMTKYRDWRDKERFEEDMRLVLSGGPPKVTQGRSHGMSYYESIVCDNYFADDVIASWSEHHQVRWAECAGKSPEELVEFLETQRAIWLVKASA